MLSYQHLYHAGNLADVHKHALLAWALDYLTRKDKPLSYLETHAGRGLYDLSTPEAIKTAEAAAGIGRLAARFAPDHPYARTLAQVRARWGAAAYPGSPLIAALALRRGDAMHLAELHPQEHAALAVAVAPFGADIRREDGYRMAETLCPPTPRRGLLLVDPPYEIKTEYDDIPPFLARIHRKWNVGVLMLWYPVLSHGAQLAMVAAMRAAFPAAFHQELAFPPIRPGHQMTGTGLFVVNPPWGLADEAARLGALFAAA